MRACYYVKPDGEIRQVKNLGWLLRRAGREIIAGIRVQYPRPDAPAMTEALLTVEFADGVKYVTDFASHTVLRGFLTRPVFYGVPVEWYGADLVILPDREGGWRDARTYHFPKR